MSTPTLTEGWPGGQRRLAISYSRFSDPKQAKGDSEDRQARDFRDFCERHNLTPLGQVYADRAKSGYKDEHRKKGKLGQLIAAAKDGGIEPGTVIVVEAWDRLGRLRPDKQTALVAELVQTGVSIGVCRLNDIFTEEDFGTHKWTTLAVFIQLAYQESKQKAERVAASWKKRREKARKDGKLITNLLPAWLELVDGEAKLIPSRGLAMKQIFHLAASGYGQMRIVRALDREKVPAFGEVVIHEGRTRSQFSGKWTRPYIGLILNDRRAMGEFQPRKLDGSPDGPPIPNYFPAAVTEEEFNAARAGQDGRRSRKTDKRGRQITPRDVRYVNTFKGLLKHARDGEGMMMHNKATKKCPETYIINTTGTEGRSRCYTFPYGLFERAILSKLAEIKPRDVLPKAKERQSRADVLRARLQEVRRNLAGLKDELNAGFSKTIAAAVRDQERLEEQVANELQEELSRTVKPAERAWGEFPGLVEMIEGAADPDDVRLRLRTVLRGIVEEMWVLLVPRGSYRLCAVQVFFVGGAVRHYLFLHQTAGFRRKGGFWKPKSDAGPFTPADLDLRKREHAQDLTQVLESVTKEDLDRMFSSKDTDAGA
jgi:DNA invertase Pin-like site-specific DNA recombinase